MNDIAEVVRTEEDVARDSLGSRSQLVSAFFDHMNAQGVAWVVMNNYEDLPQIIPSDIDFSIPPDLFKRLDSFVVDFAGQTGAHIVQKLWHGNMKCAYILATGPEGAREFVQLDFFTAFSTKGCPALIPHEELVAGRQVLRNFFVPRPEVELIFTAMRRLFKDDWSERHCSRIAELCGRITATDWLPAHYGWMRTTLEAAARGEVDIVATRRAQDWAQLRATASGNLSLPERIANLSLQIRRIAVRLRDETGQLVVLAAPRESIGTAALETLELVFHRRLFLESSTLAALPVKLALLKRRKGLIIILAGAHHPKGRVLAKWLGRLGLVDQVLCRDGDSAQPDLGIPSTCFADDAGAIEAIVRVQAAKTARAIARSGTQTSGGAK
ncbi:hypothetical protein ACFQ3C_11210 [Seohaeicola saemankumensis]|uniref:Uncharacterized protein n=1 Tax=Seohaeicola saemankumensis TaxID=481181 RepID=A0ABW3TDG3_9RHOB